MKWKLSGGRTYKNKKNRQKKTYNHLIRTLKWMFKTRNIPYYKKSVAAHMVVFIKLSILRLVI
jgi:hypothetical protein